MGFGAFAGGLAQGIQGGIKTLGEISRLRQGRQQLEQNRELIKLKKEDMIQKQKGAEEERKIERLKLFANARKNANFTPAADKAYIRVLAGELFGTSDLKNMDKETLEMITQAMPTISDMIVRLEEAGNPEAFREAMREIIATAGSRKDGQLKVTGILDALRLGIKPELRGLIPDVRPPKQLTPTQGARRDFLAGSEDPRVRELALRAESTTTINLGKVNPKEIAKAEGAVDALDLIRETFKPEFVGKILGLIPKGSTLQFLARRGAAAVVGLDPLEANAFYTAVAGQKAVVLRQMAGANLSELEKKLYTVALMDVNDEPNVFTSKLNFWTLKGKRFAQRLDELAKTGKSSVKPLTTKDLIDAGIIGRARRGKPTKALTKGTTSGKTSSGKKFTITVD